MATSAVILSFGGLRGVQIIDSRQKEVGVIASNLTSAGGYADTAQFGGPADCDRLGWHDARGAAGSALGSAGPI